MLTCEYVIEKTDAYKPNKVDVSMKMGWLYELERKIETEIVKTHENPDGLKNELDHDDIDTSKALIASGYDQMYLFWLCSQIDLHNGDLTRYNVDAAVFNEQYVSFRNDYNRRYVPLPGAKLRY